MTEWYQAKANGKPFDKKALVNLVFEIGPEGKAICRGVSALIGDKIQLAISPAVDQLVDVIWGTSKVAPPEAERKG